MSPQRRSPLVAVCGASEASETEARDAQEVGRLLASHGAIVLCGGLGGVMAAVAQGVGSASGICIGLLPGDDADAAAPDVTVALATGMGEMRNALIARCCAAMIAVGGGYGTLSEIGFALRLGRPVVALHSWEVRRAGARRRDERLHSVDTAADAVAWALSRV
jgi:uncharacterized protein (TIGR00725 family)